MGADMLETGLMEKLIERAITPHIDALRGELWAHHWLLSELLRQLPREAVRQVALQMDQAQLDLPPAERASVAAAWDRWHPYLMQRAEVLEGDTRPQYFLSQPGPAPRWPVRDR
jgi:hypothetical protein